MKLKLQVRTREQGTKEFYSFGDGRIHAINEIVKNKSYAVIDGLTVDLTSAHIYKTIFDKLNIANASRLEKMPIKKAFSIVYKLVA